MLPTLALKLAMTDGLSLSHRHVVQANNQGLGSCSNLLDETFSAARYGEARVGKGHGNALLHDMQCTSVEHMA